MVYSLSNVKEHFCWPYKMSFLSYWWDANALAYILYVILFLSILTSSQVKLYQNKSCTNMHMHDLPFYFKDESRRWNSKATAVLKTNQERRLQQETKSKTLFFHDVFKERHHVRNDYKRFTLMFIRHICRCSIGFVLQFW